MINKVILVGRATQDPERRETPNGAVVANFSLATNEKWTDKSGEKKEHTEFHKIICWGKLADLVASFVRKGKLLYIEGKIQSHEYENKNGATVHVTEINADTVQFLSRE